MADILNYQDNALCLVDDVLVYGKDQDKHDARLHEVLDRFRCVNITLDEKCVFEELNQMGRSRHIGRRRQHRPGRLSAILNMPPPTDMSPVRCFLGMANQMAKFSSSLAELLALIRYLLRKDRAWVWDSAQQSAFDSVKKGHCISTRISTI
jgi:hypothetical protein